MNTLGVSSSCINYALGGLLLHTHLRAAELIFVFCGMLDTGFIAMTFFVATRELPAACSHSKIPDKKIDKGQARAQEGMNITKVAAYSSAVEITTGVRCKRIGNACAWSSSGIANDNQHHHLCAVGITTTVIAIVLNSDRQ